MANVIRCVGCKEVLPVELFNRAEFCACPQCGELLEIEVFPALFRQTETGHLGERIMAEGEASCFYHPQKKAVVPCESCGRFLCALCDVELDGRHLCPACLAAGKKRKTIQSLEDVRPLHSRQALVLAVLPLFVTGLAAIGAAWRYWKAPGSLVRPMPWAMPLALALGILQTVAFVVLIIFAMAQ